MRVSWIWAGMVMSLSLAPAAHADCVDYSPARHNAAAAQLQRNPPTAAELGVPSLDGLVLDARASTDDPRCSSSTRRRFVYTSSLTSEQVLTDIYPYVAGQSSVDGMQRAWYYNPMNANGEIKLTSATIVEFPRSPTATNVRVVIRPASPLGALTTATQPYSIADMLDGTPWPGGANGPRQFVRADGGDVGPQAASSSNPQTAEAATTSPSGNCPSGSSASGAAAGARAGGSAGAWVGGSTGAAIGGALGGLFGSRSKRAPAQSSGCSQ